ncbi:putative UTP--glucose-1-phosphate uridylyltransferase [Helianthus annuus]|uniref:UTP--glucose-1-phosphate uridylyltransferase n=1 Tax=Helianthus annuus TaxID=4232 RepID=A0A9K3JAL8_HELAN|nr:putative UTP--glucose-1-phosphate uridylyltransferase [Helianthus annuus]KAJ0932444.1 putative UTP--glucose-1-phosphate uridylyltransferase [Helianthus annuus]
MTIHSAVIQKLLRTNAHLGRRVAENHFKIYTYGSRNGLTIIDSDKTLVCLRSACNFIGHLASQNARFLFVNTNPVVDEIIEQMIINTGCKNDTSWRLGGFLTNRFSPKRFRSRNQKFNLTSVNRPDCVVIFDTERKSSVILEATRLQIPIVGLVDPSMPLETFKKITYPKKLAAAKGNVVKEVEPKIGEAALPAGTIKIDGVNDELTVLSYKGLSPASDDPTEIKELLEKLVVVKINDNKGTKMGFDGPKSAIEIANGLTSLDLLANYIEVLNSKYGCNVPLLLMNDDSTHDETLKIVEKQSNKNIICLVKDQHQENDVKIAFDQREALLSLKKSGKLDDLLSQGKEFILMLNSDNLAEVVDLNILNHVIKNKIKYCMEIEERFRIATTMNTWVNINTIANHPETKLFGPPIAVTIPVSQNLPVEDTSDLLIFKSDLYTCDKGILIRNEARINPANPIIELGPEFEKVADFESRFKSIPSIIDLDILKVSGDVWFGSGVILKGLVSINARPGEKIVIPDGAVLDNKSIDDQQDLSE